MIRFNNHRLNVGCLQGGNQSFVVVDSGRIGRSNAVRNNSGPRDGETIVRHLHVKHIKIRSIISILKYYSKILEHFDVPFVEVVAVASHLPCAAICDDTGVHRVDIPNVQTLPCLNHF